MAFPGIEKLHDWPAQLREHVLCQWQRFSQNLEQTPELQARLDGEPEAFWLQLATVWAGSDFVADQCCLRSESFVALLESGVLKHGIRPEMLAQAWQQELPHITSEDQLLSRLRQFRNRYQMAIIWRDLNRMADLTETTRTLSALAEVCIDGAYRWLYQAQQALWGTPVNSEGEPQHLVVIGMGKLGGHELNLSSDIDLMFTYPDQGSTAGGRRSVDNQEFFVRLGQKLIRALDQQTVDGFVFRVDMRLRPYGQSGALALSFNAMEQYYQDQGRDWERYAMIKARIVAGDKVQGDRLLSALRPFVYRRYIDFGAIDALRDMKRLILREVKRKGLADNIKLGSGGIREVEFIGQAFQLIHGGREQALQHRSIRHVLKVLAGDGYLPAQAVVELDQAYQFLRNTEHALQAVADRQTQTLPKDEWPRQRLAWVMGCSDWSCFSAQLEQHRQAVAWHFSQVVADPDEKQQSCPLESCWIICWLGEMDKDEALEQFRSHGYEDPERALQLLEGLRNSRLLRTVRRQSLDRINQFMPMLLSTLAQQDRPDTALARLLDLVEAVLRRTAYLVLLMENPVALEHLIRLSVASPWVAEQIACQPVLLDEFLNIGELYSPPGKAQLAEELRQHLNRIPADDLEQQMETLRYFKQSHVLRVAAAELNNTLPVMKVSDYLTWIAEVVLGEVVNIAWQQLVQRHGEPGCHPDKSACHDIAPHSVTGAHGFIVIAYGKLGGIELGPGSDLDLVFVHDADSNLSTDGERSINNGQFFMRLGQRIVHILTTQTTSGQLYEVDMRLRPSGSSGLLVSSMTSYEQYQQNEAWTWEHQALVRARVIVGGENLEARFAKARASILAQQRELPDLRQDVLSMRQKMRDHLGTRETKGGTTESAWSLEHSFHLKHDYGGVVDIEFMVQYAVLAWSHRYPELLQFTDNFRILEQLEQLKLIAGVDAQFLRQAYQGYRLALHRQALQNESAVVSGDQFHTYRRGVIKVWQQLLLDHEANDGSEG